MKRAAAVPFQPPTAASFSLARILGQEAYDTDPLAKVSDALKAYSGWVYAAVSTISQDVRSSTWAIWDKTGSSREDWKQLDESRIPPVMVRPNATQTWGDLLELTQVHLDLAGTAYWHMVSTPGSKMVQGIQPLSPDWVTEPVLDETRTRHTGWKLEIKGSNRRTIPAEDVIFFRYPDPTDTFSGLSPVRAVALSYDMDTYSRAYAASHLRNHAQPTGILTTEAELTREQALTLADAWSDQHLGTDSIQVLGRGAAYQPLSAMLKDLEFLNLARVSRDQIFAAYHIPASRIGLIEDSSRANGEESDRVYSSLCLGPRLRRYEEPITLQLLPRLGFDSSRYAFEFDSVDVADKEFNRIAAEVAFSKGALTLDEYRAAIGFGPEANGNGDVYYMPIGSIVSDTPESGFAPFAQGSEPAPETDEPDRSSNAEVGEAGVGESVSVDLVLNGAQVTSLINIVSAMLDGSLPYASALEIIQSAFAMSEDKARKILGPEELAGSSKPNPVPEEFGPPDEEEDDEEEEDEEEEDEEEDEEEEARRVEEDAGVRQILDRIEAAGVSVPVVVRGPSSDKLEMAVLRFLSGHNKAERRLKGKLRALFSKQSRMFVKAIRDGTLRVVVDGVEIREAGDDILEQTREEWSKELSEDLLLSFRDGFDLLPADAGVGVSFSLVDERAVEFAKEEAGKAIRHITDETKRIVRGTLASGVEEGWSVQKLADAVREDFEGFKAVRAETIARTETGSAMNHGKHLHAEEVNLQNDDLTIEKTWTPTQGDDRTREWHRTEQIRNALGEVDDTIPLDQDFLVKGKSMARPHDPRGGADNVINCRCVLTYDAEVTE